VEFDDSSRIKSITPIYEGIPATINKRQVADLDSALFPTKPVVPYIQSVHDRVMLEIFRGCTRGCRFCKAGFIYRPVRERTVETLARQAKESIESAGYDELSLLSLSCSDYSRIEELLKRMITDFAGDGITVSLPSLRMDNFSLKLADLTKTPRKAGLTFAPEAGSQRMRDVINKNLTEEQIMGTLLQAEKMGWKMVKLYFMIGLPTETEEDIIAIAQLIRKILKQTRFKLNVSVSHFVPQPFTPFQWEAMESVESLKQKAYLIKDSVRNRRVQFHYHEPATSLMEGVFSRGDRRLGKVIELAFRKGSRFDGWSDYFNYSLWQDAFREAEISPEDYLRERDGSEILPWEHIYPELSKDFLLKEQKKASSQATTEDCRENCTGCGVCSDKISHAFAGASPVVLGKSGVVSGINEKVQRIRLRLSRNGILKWISHLDMQRTLERALRRSGIPMSYTEGFHPRPRVSFAIPLPLGYTSDADWMDIFLHRDMNPKEVKQALQASLPEGLNVLDVREVHLSDKTLTSDTIRITYRIELPNTEDPFKDYKVILEDFPGVREISIERKNKTFDARQLITRLEPEITRDRCQVYLDVLLKPSGSVKPDEILKVLLGAELASKCSYHRSEISIQAETGWISP
jgi:radical SAM-linked protein